MKNIINYELTEEMMLRFQEAQRYVTDNIENKRSYKPYRVLMHPALITLLTLGIVLLYLKLKGEL